MHDLVEVIGYINNVLYIALALVAFRSWRTRGGEASAWVAATFASFALIGVIGLLVPEDEDSALIDVITKITILGIVFFPYALYRFTSAIKRSGPVIDRLALAATAFVGIWTLFLGELPDQGEERSTAIQLYIVALLVQWGGLLITVAARLWRAGRGQPTLARRRMKLLSLASVGMTLALVVAGSQDTSEVNDAVDLGVQLLALLSTAFFFLAFAPPALLRMAWRRPEQEALTQATEQLVRATTVKDVIDSLLPHVTRTVGARGALLADPHGTVLGTHGDVGTEDSRAVATLEGDPDSDLFALEFDFGRLVIWASPYTPFFGHEELELLRSLGILTGLALDRTELYQREKSARASLAEAQSIAHMGSFAWEVAPDLTTWSDELYEIFGVDRSFEVSAESYYASVHPDDREMVERIVAQAVQEKRPYAFDHRVVRADGELRTLHARGKVETDDEGEGVRVVGTVQDVTAAREAERRVAAALASERDARKAVEDLNAEMESFVYTVSHDLNSPIIAIQGFADFLDKDYGAELPERGRFYVERIRASAGYLQSLIKDLLAFSRVGRVQTDPELVDLQEIVRQATEEVRGSCHGLQVQAGELPTVFINPLRARQLFTNLMQNSCRYAGRPDVSITVSSEAVDSDGGMVQISIHDNGPGIPAESRKKAFGVFERLNQESSPDGSGMGLPICKRIVETTGGTMWIADSEVGLDIRFTLPLQSAAAALQEQEGSAS